MNGGSTKGKSPIQRTGREFVIVVVIIFSSLSFTLGFFVGKRSGQSDVQYTPGSVAAETADKTRQNVAAQGMQPSADPASPERYVPQAKPTGEDALRQPQAAPVVPEKESSADTVRQVPDTPANAPAEDKKAEGKKKEKAASPGTTRTVQTKGGQIYSVQLGALKDAAEAKRLKNKYAKKGYSAYITIVSGKDKEKIYKVRAGKFNDRKDAELLAVKLKKSGDLHAFVTGGN